MVDKKNKKEVIKQPKKEVKQTKKKDVKQPKKEEYIYNPDTKRNVKKNGDVGKKVLEKYGGTSAIATSLYCCRVTTGTPTRNNSNKYVTPTPAAQAAQAAQTTNTARLQKKSLKCCPTKKTTQHSQNISQSTRDLSNCFKNTTNIPNNTFNSGFCFPLNTFLEEKEINEIFQLYENLNDWNQLSSVSIDEKYTISKKNANTQTFEITITPPPPIPPKNSTPSPSGGCDINIKYDKNIVTITKIETEKCGFTDQTFFEKLKELIKKILNELTEFVNIFEKMINVDVKGLAKVVFIAIIVDNIRRSFVKKVKTVRTQRYAIILK